MRRTGLAIDASATLIGSIAMAAGLLAYTGILRSNAREAERQREARAGVVEIHVKLASAGATVHALSGATAVFTHLPQDVEQDDARLRWVRMKVPASAVSDTLAELQRDPG